jgi:hypothetical protein
MMCLAFDLITTWDILWQVLKNACFLFHINVVSSVREGFEMQLLRAFLTLVPHKRER